MLSKLFLLFGCLVFLTWWNVASGEYTVELVSFNALPDYGTEWVNWDTLRMKKVSRNKFAVIGNFSVNRNLGDDQKILMDIYKIDPGTKNRGPLVMQMNKPFCQFIKEDETYPTMLSASNLPPQDECPFPKGEYSFKNYELETNFLPDDAPKGDYDIVLTFNDGMSTVTGVEARVTLK